MLTEILSCLRRERERQGLSLADVETRCGLRRSVLLRRENDDMVNPTLLTLKRYATALGLTIQSSVGE